MPRLWPHEEKLRDITICGHCNGAGHTDRDCNSDTVECHHFYEDHPTKSNKCSIYKYGKEIHIIQVRYKVSRQQAKITFNIQNLNFVMNFAKMTKKSASNEHQNSEKQFNNVEMSVPGVTTGGKRQREQDIDNEQ